MFNELKYIKTSAATFHFCYFHAKKNCKLYMELKNIFNVKENNFISVIVS